MKVMDATPILLKTERTPNEWEKCWRDLAAKQNAKEPFPSNYWWGSYSSSGDCPRLLRIVFCGRCSKRQVNINLMILIKKMILGLLGLHHLNLQVANCVIRFHGQSKVRTVWFAISCKANILSSCFMYCACKCPGRLPSLPPSIPEDHGD